MLARPGTLVALAVLAGLSAGAPPQGDPVDDSMAAEFAVRDGARTAGLPGESEGLGMRRVAAESAARAAWAGLAQWSEAELRPLVEDAHPNVREAALRALAFSGVAVERVPAALEIWPPARRAWAELLARGGPVSALEPLLEDDHEGVARRAVQSLFVREPREQERVFELLAASWSEAHVERWLTLERAGAEPELLARLADAAPTPGWSGWIECLRARLGEPADLERIASTWTQEPSTPAARALRLRAAACVGAAGSGNAPGSGNALGVALLARAQDSADSEVFVWVEAAAAARCPLERVPLELGAVWWEVRLAGPPEPWDPAVHARWLTAAQSEVRESFVLAVAASFESPGDSAHNSAAGELLVRALADPSQGVRQLAFASLCRAPEPDVWAAPLAAFWRAGDEGERRARLSRLPRSAAFASLCAEWVRWGDARPEMRAPLAGALAGLGSDAAAGALTRWLADAIAELEERPAEPTAPRAPPSEVEQRSVALVRGLRAVSAASTCNLRSAPILAQTAERSARLSVDVAKNALASLAQSSAGRLQLAPWLHADAPRRLRVEAALALVGSDAAAEPWLLADHALCDPELGARIVVALGRGRGADSERFLRALAAAPERAGGEGQLAIEALAARGAEEALFEIAEDGPDPVVRSEAQRVLARYPAARERLTYRFLQVDERWRAAHPDSDERDRWALEREVLLEGLARSGSAAGADAADAAVRDVWFHAPLENAQADLRARFRGLDLAAPGFRYSAELAVGSVLAQRGELRSALERAGPWWRTDARFLLALAQRARSAGSQDGRAAARELYRAGLVGLLGERVDGEREELVLDARLALFDLAEQRGDWSVAARWVERILDDWRCGDLSRRTLGLAFEGFDPARGQDGAARLESAHLQARAYGALGAAQAENARLLARQARARIGYSSAAARAQEKLEKALP